MAALVVTAALIVGGVDGSPWEKTQPVASVPAVRVAHGCAADPLCTGPPPPPDPAELVPPGTHCVDLLPAFIAAGGEPNNFGWYGNVAWGEAHCRADARNCQLPGCVWGALQIHYPSWRHLCGLTSGAELYDPETTFRCAFAIEQAAGRRQWRPHDPVTGCFPRGIGVQC